MGSGPSGPARLSPADIVDLLDRSADALFRYRLVEPRGFEYISAGITDIIGFSPQEHYADPDLGLRVVHPDDRAIVQDILAGGLHQATITMRWIHRGGVVVWTEQRLRLVADDGVPIAFEGSVRRIEDPVSGIASGDLRLDLIAARVSVRGQAVSLTPSEHRILAMLVSRDGVVSRHDLTRAVWDSSFTANERVLDVHISNLRRKLDPAGAPTRIETVKGLGYRLRR